MSSQEILNFFRRHRQTPELAARKARLREVLIRILRRHLTSHEIDLQIVGSTSNGLSHCSSDVDMCLMMVPIEKENSERSGSEKENLALNVDEEKSGLNDSDEVNLKEFECLLGSVFVDELNLGDVSKSEIKTEEKTPEDNANTSFDSSNSPTSNGTDKETLKILELVKNVLSEYSNFVNSLQIIAAKVPILKFIDRISGIEVTLNVNKCVSIRNTQLILDYTKIDWHFAPLAMTIKAWANQHGINDAYNKSISSYSLVLMVIHYLQFGCHPPILPCLHRLQPHKYNPNVDIKSVKLTKNTSDMPRWKSRNNSNLHQLLLGFLEYYSYKFAYPTLAISVRTGATIPKSMAQKYKGEANAFGHWKFLCIEEPFDRTNTARSVYDEATFDRILSVFRISHYTLRRRNTLKAIMDIDGNFK